MAEDKNHRVHTSAAKWYTINTTYLPVKGFYFFVLAAIGDLLPYMPLYMKELRLSSSETGITYGIMPFVGFFVRPVIGAIADRTQKHKVVLSLSCIFTGVFYLLILVIPSKNVSSPKVNFTMLETKIHCNEYDSYIRDCYKNESSSDENCPLSFERYIELLESNDLKTDIGFSNLTYVDSFILASSNSSNTYTVINSETSQDASCFVDCQYKTTGEKEYTTEACFTDQVEQTKRSCFDVLVTLGKEPDLIFVLPNISDIEQREVVRDRQHIGNMICKDFDLKGLMYENKPYWQMLCNEDTEMVCHFKCSAVKEDNCTTKTSSSRNMTETFWLFLVIYLFANISFAPVMSLGDAMAYDILGEKRNKWGTQRLWGTLGFALFAITSSFIMDHITKVNEQIDFSISFYIFGGFFLIAAFVSCTLPISEDFVCSQMLKNLSKLFRNIEVIIFLLAVTIFGIYTGAIETFLFWYLQDLGGWSQIIAGLSLLMNCTAEIPMLRVSGKIIKRFGQIPCLYLAFVGYTVRFIAYSFLTNPWFVLPIELLHGVTFSLMYAAASSYGSVIAPPGMSATIQGLIGGIHFGFGKGIGSLVTGVLFKALGSRWTFRLYGILAIVFLVMFALTNTLYIKNKREKKKNQGNGDDADDNETPEDHLLDNTANHLSDHRKLEEIELNAEIPVKI